MPLIRMQKSLFLVAFISSLILSMTAYSTALDKKDPPSEQTPDKQLSYTFAEVRIVFPSSLWKLVREDEKEITFYRRYKTGFENAVTISVVNLYPSAWGYTREQHIKNYFNNVRLKSRHHEESSGHHEEWSGFVEGTREIDGVHYPIMRYSIKVNGSQIDGVLMILFPDDLESRHRFYDLRLSEIYHEGKPAPGFPDLEFIVKNLEILPVLVSGAPSSTTGIQKAQAGVFDDFDSGLRVGKDHYGNPIGFITFRDSASSVINISTTSDHPQLPGEEDNNQVLQLDLDAKAWAGVLHRFENAAVDTWTPRDWRGFDGFSFWLYGNNTNTSLFVDILDNRKFRSTTRDTEGYTYTFTDNFSGWKLITVPFKELVRKEIGNDAPSDGLGLSEVHGWAFGTLNTGGSITYYIDDFEILPVLVSNDSSSVIDGGDTEAPLSLDDQISGTDIMRGSIWHTDFTEVDGKPKQTTSIAYIERKGTPNIGGTGAVPAPNSSWFAAVEVRNKEMALVLKSGDKAVQQKELFKVPKEDRLVAWPAWSPSGDQIAIIHAQLDKQRRRFSYNVTIADINGANISRHMLPEGTLHFPASMAPFNKFSWSPDEKKILISWEKAGVLNVDTGRFTRISDEPIIATWAPNSNSVYYFGMDSDIRKRGLNNFYKRDLDSAKPIKLADKSGYKKNGLRHSWCCAYGNLSFSPSGSKLMFAGGSNNEMEDVIRVYSIERDKPVDIFKPSQKLPIDAMIISTQWAPDEKSIAVLAARIEPSLELTVEILSLETQKRKTVTKIDVPGNVSEIVIMDSIGFSKSLSWTQ